ncbi:hypothetical protein GCM10022221_28530 [Actinocorallia aurea]
MHEAEQRERVAETAAREAGAEQFERYIGGSPEIERAKFEDLARDLMRVQVRIRKRAGAAHVARTFHAKAILAVEDAMLAFVPDLPEDLHTGFAEPGARYPVTVRLSNASGARQPDFAPDLRGAALRVHAGPGETHDLLMTNHPVSHARDAREFVAFARVMAGADTRLRKGFALFAKLPLAVGWSAAARMRRNVRAGTGRRVASLALETYWSRGAILWGARPVRYLLRPAADAPGAPHPSGKDPDYLGQEITRRLAADDIVFELCVQRYADARRTPVENGAADWAERDAPAVKVATLTIPRRDLASAAARSAAARVDDLAFDPWNTTDAFRPLGNLNRARKAAYEASSAHRRGYRFIATPPRRNVVAGRVLRTGFAALNRFVPWHRLPTWAGLLNLESMRQVLRERNLIDTGLRASLPMAHPVPPTVTEEQRTRRSYDGMYNDLSDPAMGAVGAPFGRNLAPDHRPDLFDAPNPVTVSEELLRRDAFLPARSLNLLAAAWIQFQVHDWVQHRRYPTGVRSVEVPMPPGRTWRNTPGGAAEDVMRFADDQGVHAHGFGQPPTLFANAASHWWDGSEIYGGDETVATSLREPGGGAELRLEDGHLPPDADGGFPLTGFKDNWWLGLSIMHTLFAREHNTVCEALRREYPRMGEDAIYHTARLVVSALIAKIHTVEWTPAILATEVIDVGLTANWSGPPRTWLTRLGLWLVDVHALTGIPGTLPDHHKVPYSLTEDFITVYRMHPLIPDDYTIADHTSGRTLRTLGFTDLQGRRTEAAMRGIGLANALYSFGIAHPGAITLHNYPRALQAFEHDGEILDLSVIDLMRSRRRGVPRYNDFRAGLHRPRVRSFEELSDDPATAAKLRDVYGTVDAIDTMVGLFAENPPRGFGFSDTAFRVFVLMASRRLQSDRFLTVDFRPEIYTPLGLDWVARSGMKSVVQRHCPALSGLLPRDASAFAPWHQVPGRE